MFQIDLKQYLERDTRGHRLLCTLSEGVVEVGKYTALRLGEQSVFARIVGISRARVEMERFDNSGLEFVLIISVLDADVDRHLGDSAWRLERQLLAEVPADAAAAAEATSNDEKTQRAQRERSIA